MYSNVKLIADLNNDSLQISPLPDPRPSYWMNELTNEKLYVIALIEYNFSPVMRSKLTGFFLLSFISINHALVIKNKLCILYLSYISRISCNYNL